MADHYRTLDASPHATSAELRTAYLKLARAHHPDRFDGSERKQAEARMQAINEAWNVLGVPHKRKEYDATRSDTSGAGSGRHEPQRGNARFRPFDNGLDDDPYDRRDVDLDPTPLSGSRGIPRWISFMPIGLVIFGVIFVAIGLLVNAAAIIAFAAIVVALGGVSFLMMPLIVMSRAEKDPNL